MNIKLLHWDDLSKELLYDMLSLRAEVFVVEQNCPYQDVDGKDFNAYHLFGFDDNQLAAYLRIIEEEDNIVWIGRVVTKQELRGNKLGLVLMKEAIKFCHTKYPNAKVKISAQSHLMDYYAGLGFRPYGEGYLEDDIPHHGMEL